VGWGIKGVGGNNLYTERKCICIRLSVRSSMIYGCEFPCGRGRLVSIVSIDINIAP